MTELTFSTGAVSSSNKNETKSSTITTTGENMMERNNNINNFNFDINAIHNGEHCIASLDPRDTRENKFWFTIAMFCTIYGVAEQTIRDNLKSLGDDGELGLHEISGRRINIKDSCGIPHPTTIYNLTVLNRLGMCCFRGNARAKEVRNKFNDVLVERETSLTTPSYLIDDKIARAERWIEEQKEARRALEAEKQGREEDKQLYSTYVDVITEQKAQINNAKTATAMGTASAAKTSYMNLRSAIRQDADGQLPQVVKGFFSTNDLFNLPWFVSLFKASVTKFCNGNQDWTNEKRAIRKGLTKKLNEIVITCLYMDMKGVAKSTVRELFSAWKDSTKTQAPMNISDDMTEHEALFRSAVGRLICVADRYQYRDKYNDPHSEPIYGYSYEVIALCLESLPESSCVKYLRDEVEIEDLRREIARVSHDGYELYQVK